MAKFSAIVLLFAAVASALPTQVSSPSNWDNLLALQTRACDPRSQATISGLNHNINLQKIEGSQIQHIDNKEKIFKDRHGYKRDLDHMDKLIARVYRQFNQNKADLQQTVQLSANQRLMNQQTLDPNHPAQGVLAKLQRVQENKVIPGVNNLQGTYTADHTTNLALAKSFEAGQRKNLQAIQLVQQQCRRATEQVQWVKRNMPEFMEM